MAYYSDQIIKALDEIQSNAFCWRNGYRACREFNKIRNALVHCDKEALYGCLYDLYEEPDELYFEGKGNRAYDCNDLATIIKTIKARENADDLIEVGIFDRKFAKLVDYKITIDRKFTNGQVAAISRSIEQQKNKEYIEKGE